MLHKIYLPQSTRRRAGWLSQSIVRRLRNTMMRTRTDARDGLADSMQWLAQKSSHRALVTTEKLTCAKVERSATHHARPTYQLRPSRIRIHTRGRDMTRRSSRQDARGQDTECDQPMVPHGMQHSVPSDPAWQSIPRISTKPPRELR